MTSMERSGDRSAFTPSATTRTASGLTLPAAWILATVYAVRGPVELSIKRQVGADQTVLAEWTSAYTEAGRRSTGVPGVSVVEIGRDGIVYHRDFG